MPGADLWIVCGRSLGQQRRSHLLGEFSVDPHEVGSTCWRTPSHIKAFLGPEIQPGLPHLHRNWKQAIPFVHYSTTSDTWSLQFLGHCDRCLCLLESLLCRSCARNSVEGCFMFFSASDWSCKNRGQDIGTICEIWWCSTFVVVSGMWTIN